MDTNLLSHYLEKQRIINYHIKKYDSVEYINNPADQKLFEELKKKKKKIDNKIEYIMFFDKYYKKINEHEEKIKLLENNLLDLVYFIMDNKKT